MVFTASSFPTGLPSNAGPIFGTRHPPGASSAGRTFPCFFRMCRAFTCSRYSTPASLRCAIIAYGFHEAGSRPDSSNSENVESTRCFEKPGREPMLPRTGPVLFFHRPQERLHIGSLHRDNATEVVVDLSHSWVKGFWPGLAVQGLEQPFKLGSPRRVIT